MSHQCIWVGELWLCMACDFSTTDDELAKKHGMTGLDRILDEMGVPD